MLETSAIFEVLVTGTVLEQGVPFRSFTLKHVREMIRTYS